MSSRTRAQQGKPADPVQSPHDAPRPARGLSAAQLLTAEQVAERLQVPKAHIYRLSRTGQIPTVRLGKYYRYHIEEIEAWVRAGGTSRA